MAMESIKAKAGTIAERTRETIDMRFSLSSARHGICQSQFELNDWI
jgi:hypothetical protein